MKNIPHFAYRTNFGKYETLEDWKYTLFFDGTEDFLNIPAGFCTNGASIPRIFWAILSPFDPRYMEEATIHDFICDKGQYARADDWFERLLIDNTEIKTWHRKVFIGSVRFWHWFAYQKADYFGVAKPKRWLKILKGLK